MAAAKWGWYRDPSGRHELRRWDGDGWSEWVIDADRRSFDDIDGCGGPPEGEMVAVDDQPPRVKRLRPAGGETAPRTTAGSGDTLLPADEDAASLVVPAVVTALLAGLAAGVVMVLGRSDAVPGLNAMPDELVRRFLLPLVAATAVFEAMVALGLLRVGHRALAAGGRTAWRVMRTVTRDEMLRGLIAFLMALFARTFVVSTFAGPFAGAVRPIGPLWLFAAEAVLLLAVAPVVEERLFRGVVFVGLRHRFGPVKAVLGSAAVYGLATSWSGVTTTATTAGLAGLAVGAVFAWFVHAGHDLRPLVVAHFLLNFWFLAERVLAS